ncbi:hypothetical protein PENSPDRAFT_406772 [Peniophora sp. CONT]|nr:hypothetical protein PENSPDRAFT_406772 [Peniophora sp. CONT]
MSPGPDLPVEVLCSIFRYVSLEDFTRYRPLGWLPSTTHVCRKWRKAATGLSELWAENLCALASTTATDTFLERAQSAPLVFSKKYFETVVPLTKHQLALAEIHLDRARIFEQPGPIPSSLVKAVQATTLSHLSVLHLHRWDNAKAGSFLVEFTLNAPVLRELHLDSVFFPVNAPLLRVLAVTNDRQPYQGSLEAVPTSEILNVLKGTPLLENLKLEGMYAFAMEEDKESGTATRVELPELRSLRLEDQGSNYGLYCFVNAAPTTDVSIINAECNAAVDPAITFAAFEGHLRAPAYDTLLIYEEQDDGGTHVNVRLRSSTSTRAHYDDDGEPEFRFDGDMDYMGGSASSLDIIGSLTPHINVDAICFLDMGQVGTHEFVEVEANEVRETLAFFTSVSTVMLNIDVSSRHIIAIRGEDAGEIGEEGGDEGDEGDEDGGEDKGEDGVSETNLPLPALQHLIVQDLSSPHRHSMSVEALEEGWSVLLAILKERKRAGRAIRYLTLSESDKFSGITGDALEAIQERDAEFMHRAEGLVDEIFDKRGYRQWQDEEYHSGRISEYVQQL